MRIQKVMQAQFDGNPWTDIAIVPTLTKLTAAQTAKKVSHNWNTIWEIVNHLIAWRKIVLERMQDNTVPSPEDNCFAHVADTSDTAWTNTLKDFYETQAAWNKLLADFDEENFEKVYAGNGHNHYEHIIGIVQHDAYHLGQIVLLSKAV